MFIQGPMVYACAYCPVADKQSLSQVGYDGEALRAPCSLHIFVLTMRACEVADSKQLSEEQREHFYKLIQRTTNMGWRAKILSAEELSTKMCKM